MNKQVIWGALLFAAAGCGGTLGDDGHAQLVEALAPALPGPVLGTVTPSGPPISSLGASMPGAGPIVVDKLGDLFMVAVPQATLYGFSSLGAFQQWQLPVTPQQSNRLPNDATTRGLALGVTNMAVAGFVTSSPTFGVVEGIAQSGSAQWNTFFTGTGPTVTDDVSVAPDGSFYVAGWSQGVLTGQVPRSSGGGFVSHISATGGILATIQTTSLVPPLEAIVVDSGGQITIESNNSILHHWAPNFVEQWKVGSAASPIELFAVPTGVNTLYDLAMVSGAPTLEARSLSTGALTWQRSFGTETKTIAAGTTWTGSFLEVTALVADDTGVYVAGQYLNSYAGPSAPPGTSPLFVMHVDSSGNEVWFDLFEERGVGYLPAGMTLGRDVLLVSGATALVEVDPATGGAI